MAVSNGVHHAEELKQRGDAAYLAGMHADAVMLHRHCFLPCASQQTGVTRLCASVLQHVGING